MTFAPDDSFLSSDQDTNKFLVYVEIDPRSLIQLLEILQVELTQILWMLFLLTNACFSLKCLFINKLLMST